MKRQRDRIRAEQNGRRAETIAALYLRCKFYRILARRFRTQVGEIDLIIKRGSTIAFVEVKQRASHAQAAQAISPASRRRIERTAAVFLAKNPRFCGCTQRLDAVFIMPKRWPLHIEGAWDETAP